MRQFKFALPYCLVLKFDFFSDEGYTALRYEVLC
jgi:hypothetical protein